MKIKIETKKTTDVQTIVLNSTEFIGLHIFIDFYYHNMTMMNH